MRILLVIAIIFGFGVSATPVHAEEEMTIEEAYKLVKPRRAQFDKNNVTSMSFSEAGYLDKLFYATDQAFRERMIMLKYFKEKNELEYLDKYNNKIEQIIAGFALTEPPSKPLQDVEKLVIEAIEEQRDFFNKWSELHGKPEYDALMTGYPRNQLVYSSHIKLTQSYGILKKTYSSENGANQQSFYDHLFSLDFLY